MPDGPRRDQLVAALRGWLYPEDGEGGHLYRERIATQQAERAVDQSVLPLVDRWLEDAEFRLARVRALVAEHPVQEVPVVQLDDLIRALEG